MIRLTKSQPVALLGEAPPRVRVAPPESKSNSWEDVADLSAKSGIMLDEWQEEVLRCSMGERSDATWSAKRVGLSVPRQNGKSQLLVARALAGALLFGERKIVISAHQQDTARESFTKMLELIEADANGWLRERIRPNGIMQALNREAIRFANGATIQFKARSGAGGRGFSSDCLMLDEAQILSQRAWVSINSTMSAMPNPQVWLLGTPPTPEDDGAVFESIRSAAIAGGSKTTAYLEWSAEVGSDPADEFTRWSANPAWNTRINHEIVQGEFETYPVDRFALDRLGQWMSEQWLSAFPNWRDLAKPRPDAPAVLALGIATDRDQTTLSLGAVIAGEFPHLAVADRQPATARKAFAANVARIQSERGCEVLIRGKNFLIPDLEDAGVAVRLVDSFERAQAHTDLDTTIKSGELEHGDYPDLNAAVSIASWRTTDTGRSLDSRAGDISALEAVALALYGAEASLNYDPLSSVL